jgi:hypothetical protein
MSVLLGIYVDALIEAMHEIDKDHDKNDRDKYEIIAKDAMKALLKIVLTDIHRIADSLDILTDEHGGEPPRHVAAR